MNFQAGFSSQDPQYHTTLPTKTRGRWMISLVAAGCLLAVVAVVMLAYRMGEVTVLATLKKYPKEERDAVFEKWCLAMRVKGEDQKERRLKQKELKQQGRKD
jgi:hypothetical protein